MRYLILDTETTGVPAGDHEPLSVALIDDAGTVLLDTLVRPVRRTRWPEAERIHGIRPQDVLRDDVPTLAELAPRLAALTRGQTLVIYNAAYDTQILAEALQLGPPTEVKCAMLAFSQHPEVREWNDYRGDWRWQSLATAASTVGHQWTGRAHGALADCFATRDVWAWLTYPDERARLEAGKKQRWQEEMLLLHVKDLLRKLDNREAADSLARVRAWEAAHFPALGIPVPQRNTWVVPPFAEQAADVFCRHLTGHSVGRWNSIGELRLALPRYQQGREPAVPAELVSLNDVHFLPAIKLLQPDALLVASDGESPSAAWFGVWDLYELARLQRGVHYVPFATGWPTGYAGYCSMTALARDHKIPKAVRDTLLPAFLKRSRKYAPYLLYAIPAPETAVT